MSGRAVQVVIIFLDVLPMIGLAVGQAERALLEYRVLAVPQCQRKAQSLVIVAETGEAVLPPVISARTGLIVTKIVPCVPVAAVVLAHGAPLAFAEVGPPLPPGNPLLPRFIQPLRLGRLGQYNGGGGRLRHQFLSYWIISARLSRRTRSDRTPRAAP